MVFNRLVSVNSKSYLRFKELLKFIIMGRQTPNKIHEQTIKLSNKSKSLRETGLCTVKKILDKYKKF